MQYLSSLCLGILLIGCQQAEVSREETLFNDDWEFFLGQLIDNEQITYWANVDLPHDWSIRESYQQEQTAASTGFVPGGVGWYRKQFSLADDGRDTRIIFDGVYCNAEVWINGHHLGIRSSGYSSFEYDLTTYLNDAAPNELLVKVDHSAYVDARWYTGSGIYRNVHLVRAHPTHLTTWGTKISTTKIEGQKAMVVIDASVTDMDDNTTVKVEVVDAQGTVVAQADAEQRDGRFVAELQVGQAQLWGLLSPHLYEAVVQVYQGDNEIDRKAHPFGIRRARFDADQGFFLNGENIKIKGVNLHHDAGALGAAVPKSVWEYRVAQLQSIGVNAIRMSHNPHSVELMEVCDEMGMLVMDEFFDEWHSPKGKSLVYLGDNAAKGAIAEGYSEVFFEWAERDLKDLIRRDYNHPSVVMWSIGNEIEWTFPDYSKAFAILNPDNAGYGDTPEFDPKRVKAVFDSVTGGTDSLAIVAEQLSRWVREEDTTRAITCGSVRPAIAAVSGYADAVDVLGFNYRAECYDAAHETYPDMKIIGSENWGTYSEWTSVNSRPFVAGMFAWTGFAYMGEAGPWPRKGLNISFFDFAGFKTPRGHFFECLWRDEPKVYAVTARADESEYSYDEGSGWQFDMQMTPAPVWSQLRRWEWYQNIHPHWNYQRGESVIVQAYSNCEEVELLLNGESLGRKKRSDFSDDNIVKWQVPFDAGVLTVHGYIAGQLADEYVLETASNPVCAVSEIEFRPQDDDGLWLIALQLVDEKGRAVSHQERELTVIIEGAKLVAVDNGWEQNVSDHFQSKVTTHEGRAMLYVNPVSGAAMDLNVVVQ
ncbi:DUF4982 domain-containing protein [Reichenbachiella agarivorans]|uniref:DUF4982 domain-containing protein n=2 Tax=Reichenbachiella agarivorans TaxID=2979464 RepID=A0ABY6D154_9BACT|nr:DUF4982 domain-containing protein [Reichenbachiella agarivorans]